MLSSLRAGVLLFCSATLSSVIIGFVSGRLLAGKAEIKSNKTVKYESKGFSEAFTLSASQATSAMLSVCAYMLIFSAVCAVIGDVDLSENLRSFIVSVSEVTNGVMLLSGRFPLPAVAAVIGFGGLCVHCQVMGAVIESGLKLRYFFAVRFICAALSAAVCEGLLYFFPITVQTLAGGEKITALPFQISLPCCIVFLLMSVSLIFDIAPRKKV
jgi:hypothetical protein